MCCSIQFPVFLYPVGRVLVYRLRGNWSRPPLSVTSNHSQIYRQVLFRTPFRRLFFLRGVCEFCKNVCCWLWGAQCSFRQILCYNDHFRQMSKFDCELQHAVWSMFLCSCFEYDSVTSWWEAVTTSGGHSTLASCPCRELRVVPGRKPRASFYRCRALVTSFWFSPASLQCKEGGLVWCWKVQ